MRHGFYKDFKRRRKFCRTEAINVLLKSVCLNDNLERLPRSKFYNYISSRLYRSSFVKMRNFCVLTSNSRSVNKTFKLNRIVLRGAFLRGLIYSVRKSIW